MPSIQHYIRDIQSQDRYHFLTEEAAQVLGISLPATQAALRRLKAKGEIADPYRGFHVVVPPGYRRFGCVQADRFIPQLMKYLGEPYYVALLSAGAYYAAAHQKPQIYQVMVQHPRRRLVCGAVHVQFVSRKDMLETPVIEHNTRRGTICVASAEATACEVVGYPRHSGGLNNVATVLTELAESIDAEKLAAEAHRAPLAWVQRLGYLLSLVGASDLAAVIEPIVRAGDPHWIALAPSMPKAGHRGDPRWKVSVNTDVEPDDV